MVPVPVCEAHSGPCRSRGWNTPCLCPLSSVVTAGPGLRPDTEAHQREGGGSFGHMPIIPVLSNNIKRQNQTSWENINYFRSLTRVLFSLSSFLELLLFFYKLFIFALKLSCQGTWTIYLGLKCFVQRNEDENWVEYLYMQSNLKTESIENFFCFLSVNRIVKTFTFTYKIFCFQ